MAWIGDWALVLGGIDSMVYNTEQRLKAPFREKLRQKYTKKYNEPNLISDFTKDARDIFLFSRYYSHMSTGNGLFILHLMNEYKKQGKQTKIIMAGAKGNTAQYFIDELGYSVTEMDAKDENWKSVFENSIHDSENVLTISETMSHGSEYSKKPSFFTDIIEKIFSLPKDDNTVYIVTTLFIHNKESKKALDELNRDGHVRLLHFHLDLPNIQKILSENGINVFFPHYGDKEDSKHIYKELKTTFPSIPPWIFKKKYFPYYHFVYQKDGKEGIFFMDKIEKPDKYK